MKNIAMIGAGRIGKIHAANIMAHPELRLVRVVDPFAEAAAAIAGVSGAVVSTMDEVIADTSIDGVLVASSTDTHLEYTLRAAQAGKAVFCEKPLDLDYERATQGAAQLEQIGAPVFLAFNRRFDPNFAKLKTKIDAGDIGSLETLHIISHDPAPPPVSYLKTSGGMFKDMVIHDFDMARWLLADEPVAVFSTSSCLVDCAIADAGDVDTAKTILRTASGRLCVISSSRRSGYGYDQRIEAFGSAGALRAGNVTESTIEHWNESGARADAFQNFFLDRYRDAYALEIAHFAEILARNTKPAVGYADGVAALALAEAASESTRTGAFVLL